MLGGSISITNGVVLVATIVGWNHLLNLLGFRISWFERLMSPPPLQVIRDGQLLRKNMRRELLTLEDLKTHMREDGIQDITHVRSAFVEGDGNISIIPYER